MSLTGRQVAKKYFDQLGGDEGLTVIKNIIGDVINESKQLDKKANFPPVRPTSLLAFAMSCLRGLNCRQQKKIGRRLFSFSKTWLVR